MSEKLEKPSTKRIPFFRQLVDRAGITSEVEDWQYDGSGTEEDPYVVTWITNDPRNPMEYTSTIKWSICFLSSLITMAVSLVSSAYSGGMKSLIAEFECSEEVYTLGLSLFVLGFALGPLFWAPVSEVYGRQSSTVISLGVMTAFNAGAAGANDMGTLIVLRFFAGAFGSSPLTNTGGILADIFAAEQRGLALALFAAMPFLGPTLGPIIGGFIGETIGWRWIQGVMAIFTGIIWIISFFAIPETYAPVLLRIRAKKLSEKSGKVYRTKNDIDAEEMSWKYILQTSIIRPWILLFCEPIVLLLTLYMSIIYGTLYLLFGAFPIVYQEGRGWSPGIGGLPFIGVIVGLALALAYVVWDNRRYAAISREHGGYAPPESRLPPCMVGGIALPIGLFWFAWTNQSDVPWIVSVLACIPFGFGMVLVFVSASNYLIDSYVIFAASVIAGNALVRALFGTAFPLFTSQLFSFSGIHWASSVPAFLALGCVPFPFLFYMYGPAIRKRCKYSAKAAVILEKLQAGGKDSS